MSHGAPHARTSGPVTPDAMVVLGATGDLAMRMLFPSLYFLDADGLLPEAFRVVGAARADLDAASFLDRVRQAVAARADGEPSPDAWARFAGRVSYHPADAREPESFAGLVEALAGSRSTVFYLSTSPDLFAPICAALRSAGLSHGENAVMVEKPIGHDLKSCQAINDVLAETFREDRIFRVDHYLGKEAVQNLLALRFANTLFEPLWNKAAIDHVQITVAETVGVEGRRSYYDDYGALRDMVQNHMLQLLCLVAMEPPASLEPNSVRNEKIKVLQSLRPIRGRDVERYTVRAQYGAGVSGAASVPGYEGEGEGRPSGTETFVAIVAHVDNWRWAGTPFYLRTGKRLPHRSSEIVIQFRDAPHNIFHGADLVANRLTIKLQPEEEIALSLMNKTPSLEHGGLELAPLSLNLSLAQAFKDQRPRRIAYERLILEAIKGDQTLFVRRDEQETAWRWIDDIRQGWDRHAAKLSGYGAGTWGPAGAFALIERYGHSWSD